MKHIRIFALIAGATLILTGALAAQSTTAKTAPKTDKTAKAATSSLKGSVKSISDSELVVEQKSKELKFSLNSDTQKEGDIKPGTEVSVEFRFENMKDVAVKVQALPAKNKKGL